MTSAEDPRGAGDAAVAATPNPSGGAQPLAANKPPAIVSGEERARAAGEEREAEAAAAAAGCKGRADATPVDDDAAAISPAAARGGEETNSNSGGRGVGLSMLAKIKGRFARHTAARSGDSDRQKLGAEVEHDQAAG